MAHPAAKRMFTSRHGAKLPERELAPLNAITYLGPIGLVTIPPEAVQPEKVGWKAYGLSATPPEWVPKFLVISADCFRKTGGEKTPEIPLREALLQAGIE